MKGKQLFLLFAICMSGIFGTIENVAAFAAPDGVLSAEQKRELANEQKLRQKRDIEQRRALTNEKKLKRQQEFEQKRKLANQRKLEQQQEAAQQQKMVANLQKEIICNAESTPPGWITASVGKACSQLANVIFYERTILKIDGLQSGSNLNICSGDRTPPGWITVSTGKPCHQIGNSLIFYARTIKKL